MVTNSSVYPEPLYHDWQLMCTYLEPLSVIIYSQVVESEQKWPGTIYISQFIESIGQEQYISYTIVLYHSL